MIEYSESNSNLHNSKYFNHNSVQVNLLPYNLVEKH